MYTIEFDADVCNGVIKLPPKFQNMDNKHLRVIAFVDQENINDNQNSDGLKTNTNFFFDELEKRHFIIDQTINIDEVMQGMND